MVIICTFSFFRQSISKKKDQAFAWSISLAFALALSQIEVPALLRFERTTGLRSAVFAQRPQADGGNET